MKISVKRLGAFVLALVMVLGLIPVMNNTANAVDVTGLTDTAIGVSYALGNNPSGTAGVKVTAGNALSIVAGGKLLGTSYMISANTVTITNNKGADATLSFDFTLSGTFGSVEIDGTKYTAATTDTFVKDLEKNASITITVTPKRTAKASGGNDLTMTVTNLALVTANAGPVTTTFEAPAYGSYTIAYGENSVTMAAGDASQNITNEASVGYTLTAVPGEGNKLVGWYDSVSGKYLSTETSFVAYIDKPASVQPVIVPANYAVFMVGDKDHGYNYYTDLNKAVEYAQDSNQSQITLVQSGVLEAGASAYVIPEGISLLIPRDTDYTPTTIGELGPEPEYEKDVVAPYAYMTLTLGKDAVLEINGTLDVEAMITTAQGSGAARPYGGRPIGGYGAIEMSPDSTINVRSGATVYAWGYIYGAGTINAYDGAEVYEVMQILDFPGGTLMGGFADSDLTFDLDTPNWPADTNPTNDYIKTFPFSQYYVQNIEVALNLYTGASEYVFAALTVGGNISKGMPLLFIGEGGMFCADGGYITKKYNSVEDRLEVTVNGDSTMAGITIDMSGTSMESLMLQYFGAPKLDSNTYILSLNSNITITIASGTTTVKQDLSLLPGVELNVDAGAKLVLAQREFAEDEYDNLTIYGTGGYNVYLWDLENWGTYAFQNQYLIPVSYSPTRTEARTYEDLKDVVLNINGTVETYGFIYSTTTFDEDAWVPVSGGAKVISTGGTGKLVLMNGCGTEDLTYCLDGKSDKDHYMYIDSVWLQNEDGSFLLTQCDYCSGLADETVEECQHYGMEYNYCDVHGCWYTENHGDCTLTNIYEITWVVNGQGAPEEYEEGQTPFYKGATPTKPADGCTTYTFAGWATSANGEVLAELPAVTGEAAYYAIFTEGVSHTGELDYTDNGDTHSAVYDCCGAEYVTGEGHTYSEGLCDCGKKQTFTIKWNNNGTIMETDVVEYGEVPVYNGATPTKTAVGYTYTFTSWSPAVVAATKDMTYNAVYSASVNSHFVILKDENGTELGRVEYEYNAIISQSTLDAYAQKKCYTLDDWYYENGQSFRGTRMGDEDIVLIAKWNGPNHSWVDADCDNDGYCSVCGEAGDPAQGHSYNYDCDTNCSVCGKLTRPEAECVSDAEYNCQDGNCIYCGEPVSASENHDWLDATCTEAATCGNCGATTGSALGHGTIKGWDYIQIDNDLHQVWCKDCYRYTYEDGHDYVNHVCSECGWTERMIVEFYNGDTLWRETTTEYGGALGIAGMEVPAAPTGYKFAGWYTAGGVKVVHGMTITEDIVAYATWAKQTFTITWIVDGVPTEEVYEYGATPSFKGSTDKAADGCTVYTFDGWDKDIVAVTGNVTYTAQYTTGISHTGEVKYTNNGNGTHNGVYECCNTPYVTNEAHTYVNGVCACGAIKHICSENLTEVEAVEADCDTNGVKAYWSCSCGKYYADANASTEIPDLAAWKNGDGKIEKLGHGHTEGLYYEEEGENTHSIFCDDCYTTIQWNVKCTDAIDDGDHKCDFCPNENITGHSYDPATHECECGALETFTVTWLFNGGVMNEATKQELISEGFTVTDTSASSTFPYGDFAPSVYGITKDGYNLVGYTDQYGNFNEGQEIFTLAEDMTFTLVWECAHAEKNYTDLKNGFHKVTCGTCGETLVESEGHDYTYDSWDHKCQCGAVEKFKLTVVYGVNGEYTFEAMLPYWTRMDSLDVINNIPWRVYVNDATHFGYFYLDDFYWDMDGDGDLDRDRYFTEGYMAGRDMYVEARYDFNGFVHDGNGWKYRNYGSFYKNMMVVLTKDDVYENGSDEELEGAYMLDADGYRIENGMGRWYYMGYNPFSGITYEPNAEDIAYYESKGQTFIDKEMTWYYFGADGKLAENYTGLVGDSYVINGQAAWHIGLVEIDGEYYYFKGDEVNGGNKMVSGGDFYLNRNNTSFNLVPGGIYTFDNDGKMQWKFHGIEESDLFEGKRHYIGGRLTPGLGLVDLITAATDEVRYFYVDSYGQLILDAEYYIGANSFGLAKGIYYFDAEGFLVIPEEEPGKSGLFFEDGKWYYYVDGAKAYCAGLIQIDGNWVYVKSDGSLATGIYYITNNNGHATIASGTKCTFDDNGVMIDPVINKRVLDEGNCTIENFDWDSSYVFAFTPDQDSKLTIEVSNIVLDDEYENVGFVVDVLAENYGWLGENFVQDGDIEYYVSSNMGQCWVYIYPAYDAGDYCDTAPGTFDYKISIGNDGSPKNGIIDGYYYVDGHIAYAAGLIEINGIYYYVRSNGQIVTDCQYWITNVNDTGYEPGMYEFDVDGWMSEIYVDTFTGIKDGYFYMDDEIAYNAGLKQYNGGYIYVRSNGQVATGKYWITNHNDLLPEGFYDFGEDGFYYPPVPENAYLVKDVVKNTETDGFYGYLGTAEGILPQADGMLYIEVTDITYAEEILNAAGFDIFVDSSDYWARELGPSVVGTATIMMPVTAGNHYVIFVNPADIDGEGYSLINGTISYKIWSTVECELKEVSIGE